MRKKIAAGNWKMNKTCTETKEFFNEFKGKIANSDKEVIFFLPSLNLPCGKETLADSFMNVGCQNIHFENSGAYTGEVSADMLLDLGIENVLIGHSERREYFGETDQDVNKKTLKALEKNLKPMICVGETLSQREEGITTDLLRLQTKIALKDVSEKDMANVVIAYEPIWAIGTGKTATAAEADKACGDIRCVIGELYGKTVAENTRILYGGSVSPANASELFAMENIDGGLVGGASLKMDFIEVINA